MKKIPEKIIQYEFFNTYFLFYCGYLLSSKSFMFYPCIILGYYLHLAHFILKTILIFLSPFLPSYILWIVTGGFYRVYQNLFEEESCNYHKNFILGMILGNIIEPNLLVYFTLSIIGFIIIIKNKDLSFLQTPKLDKTQKLNKFYKNVHKNEISKDETNLNFLSKILIDKILGVDYKPYFYVSLSMIFGFLKVASFYKILIMISFLLPTPKFKLVTVIFFIALYFDLLIYFIIPFSEFDFFF